MNSEKEDSEALMNSFMPLAEQLLTDIGEFSPFAGAMAPDGEIIAIEVDYGEQHVSPADAIKFIKKTLARGARQGEYRATAIFYNVTARLPSTDEKSDAIAISLDHRDRYSGIVLIPYNIVNGTLILGEAFAQQGEFDIFPTAAVLPGPWKRSVDDKRRK